MESNVRVRLNGRVRGFVGEGDKNGSEESKSKSTLQSGNSSFTGLANRFPPPGKDCRPVMIGGVAVSLNDFVFFMGERRVNSKEEDGVGRLLCGETGVGGAATISSEGKEGAGDESSLSSVRGEETAEETGDLD